MRDRLTWLMVVVALFALGAAACGDDDERPTPAATEEAHEDGETTEIAFEMDSETVLHHWQALAAIESGELDDARHHIDHIIGFVGDADAAHATAMQDALAAIEAGDLHDAEHELEEMVSGHAESALTAPQLHAQMALTAVNADEVDDATHHLEHAIAGLPADESGEFNEVLDLLHDGDHSEAAEPLADLALAMSDDAHAGDDDHDADEAHDDDHEAELEADREVTIVMTEFAYEADVIRAAVGERVRIVLRNDGAVLHDLTAEDFVGTAEATGSVESHDSDTGDHHGDEMTFHAAANGGDTVELVFEADEAGEFELFCTVPAHRELGMTATLIVE